MDENLNPKQYFITLKIIHSALVIGQIVFAGIIHYIVETGNSPQYADLTNPLLLLAVFITFGGLFGANFIYRTKLKNILPSSKIQKKLFDYRVAIILHYSILETPSLFAGIAYFLTANYLFLIFALVIVVYFFINSPGKEKVNRDLNLNDREKEEIKRMSDE